MLTWHRFSQTISILIFCTHFAVFFAQIYMFSTYIFSYLALMQFYKRVNVWSLSRDTWQPRSFPKVSLEKSLGQTSPMWDRSTKKFSVISCPSLCHQCWGFSHMKEDMSQKCQSSGAPWKVWKTQKFRKDSRLLWVRWRHVKAWSFRDI